MLKLKNLTISYGDRVILDDVDVSFPSGYVIVIQGASGSGKSSLLNVLGLMQKVDKNCQYYYNHLEISQYNERKKADFRLHHIGFVFQQNNLLPEFSAYENVLIPRILFQEANESLSKSAELLEYVGLNNLKNSYPSRLSGGEEQRIAISRALANDADIILADEPTASLDAKNSQRILDLLKQLAHDLKKTVIIVSHAEKVAEIADILYKIEDKKIHLVKSPKHGLSDRKAKKTHTNKTMPKRKLFQFSKFYTKQRTGDKTVNKVFVAITAVIAAMSMMSVNFGENFATEQEAFMNSISDKSIFVVNDTAGSNAHIDYPEANGIDEQRIKAIEQIPYGKKWYPYYEFLSVGIVASNDSLIDKTNNAGNAASVTIKDNHDVISAKSYENTLRATSNSEQFSVVPLYPEENMDFLLEAKSQTLKQGILITNGLAKKFGAPLNQLIDKDIVIKAFVPVKLYSTKMGISIDPKNPHSEVVERNADGRLYKLVEIKDKIRGVLSPAYNLQRGIIKDNFLLPYETFNNIVEENKDQNFGAAYQGFPEKPLQPSAILVIAENYDDVPQIMAKLHHISPTFSVKHTAMDIEKMQHNISAIKSIMTIVTFIFICIVILMFGLLYFMKNRTRKREVGILKAIGLTKFNITYLISFEMGQNAVKSFIYALILAFIMAFFSNNWFGVPLFDITLLSMAVGFLVAIVIVMLAGILPIYRASLFDPIDAIRSIGK